MYSAFIRVVALSAFAALCLGTSEGKAANLSTTDFLAACIDDPIVADDPAFEANVKVSPKTYCECVAGKLEANKLSQADVDMLTKMHNEDITDADAESYPTLDDLLVANEGYEDACKQSLGLITEDSTDIEESPLEEDLMPEEDLVPEEGAAPPEDDGSPPE